MPYLLREGNDSVDIYFEDYGSGQPVILIHGWPLSHKMWEYQVPALIGAGFRVVAYDRRGFGESGEPWTGYDYDTMADDLQALLETQDLTDAVLVGFSMGGGEVARYLGKHGSERIAKAMLVSAVTPYMLKTEDNPEGVEQSVFDEMKKGVKSDRIKFLADFGKQFVNADKDPDAVSDDALHYNKMIAAFASPKATLDCIDAFAATDFRSDLESIDVPVLLIHGDADQIVPLEVSAKRAHDIISESRLEVIEGAPHGLNYTHTEELNKLMLGFLKE